MGMLGALAGVGKGLQDYSTILGEKAKRDWEEQRDLARFEREKNLERLKIDRQRENITYQDELATTRQSQQNEAELNRLREQAKIQSGVREEERVYAAGPGLKLHEKLKEIDANASVKVANANSANQIELMFSKAAAMQQIADEKDDKKKAKSWEQLQKSELYQLASPAQKMIMELATTNPDAYTAFAGVMKNPKVDSISAEVSDKIRRESQDQLEKLQADPNKYKLAKEKYAQEVLGLKSSAKVPDSKFENDFRANYIAEEIGFQIGANGSSVNNKGVLNQPASTPNLMSDRVKMEVSNMNDQQKKDYSNKIRSVDTELADRFDREFRTPDTKVANTSMLGSPPEISKKPTNVLIDLGNRNIKLNSLMKKYPKGSNESDLSYKTRLENLLQEEG